MSYKTREYVHTDDNGEVVSSIRVYVVDDEHDGETVQTVGQTRVISKGDVLIQCPNPNFWDVLSADEFSKTGYADANAPTKGTRSTSVSK